MSLEQIALPLLKATHTAAIACVPWIARGDGKAADKVATEALRQALDDVPGDGCVVIGEGEKDQAPMLYAGERVGTGQGVPFDLAVDPLEGTKACARGAEGSITVVAAAPAGALCNTVAWYMDKLVIGFEAPDAIDITRPIEENVPAVAAVLGKPVSEVSVVVLDKPRHRDLIDRLRALGCRVRLIPDGDVMAALSVLYGQDDLLAGIGGAPEGVLTACMVRCLGGTMQAMLAPQSEDEAERIREAGDRPGKPLRIDDLVASADCCFVATGVTDSSLLRMPKRSTGGTTWRTHSFLATSADSGLLIERTSCA